MSTWTDEDRARLTRLEEQCRRIEEAVETLATIAQAQGGAARLADDVIDGLKGSDA